MVTKAIEKTYWTDINQVPKQYPWLTDNLECEIAIVGGGVTASLCALKFAGAGLDTIMLSASPIGFGGTAASGGMMSVDGEQCIATLVDKIGADRAMMATQMLSEALNNIEALCGSFDQDCGFRRMDSLRYAEDIRNAEILRREYSLRLHNGINVQLLTNLNSGEHFTFPMEAGVYSEGMAAQLDPYSFAHAATNAAVNQGVRVFENTSVNAFHKEDDGYMTLKCDRERQVRSKYVIVATGLDTQQHCGGMDKSVTVCTIVTQPIDEFSGWRGPCQIRSQGSPSTFLTVTPDSRILMGGITGFSILESSYVSRMLDMIPLNEKRYEQLEKRLRTMFPAIRNMNVEYVYASKNGRTDDGLPVLGRKPEEDKIAYALCCGDDGLLYSEIASRLLLEQYQGKSNQQLGLFSPGREWRLKH